MMVGAPDAIEILRRETARFEIPVVFMDDPPPLDWATRVVNNDRDGLRQALEHLLALGHRRIGFVSAQRNSPLAEHRRTLFLEIMEERSLPVPHPFVLSTDWLKPEIIEPAVRELLSPGRSPETYPTALLTGGDLMAMVTMRTARALGCRVPEDLSVIGFADFLSSAYSDPPLTTIAQPYEEIELLATLCLLDGVPPPDQEILVPTKLILRASTVPPSRTD